MLESPQRRSADGGRKLHQRAALRFAQVGHHLWCMICAHMACMAAHTAAGNTSALFCFFLTYCCTFGLTHTVVLFGLLSCPLGCMVVQAPWSNES